MLNDNWEKEGGESRTEFYRSWRTKVGIASVSDVDQVEYVMRGGDAVPVAIIELSVADYGPPPGFFDAILHEKLSEARGQGKVLRLLAERLKVDLYGLILLKDNTSDFWLYNITKARGWKRMTEREFVQWLGRIREAR